MWINLQAATVYISAVHEVLQSAFESNMIKILQHQSLIYLQGTL